MENREKMVDEVLNRGVVVNILPDKESFRKRLLSDDPLKIYIGADPTSTSLHLSHAKNYMFLEDLRKLGHKVVVLFGDFTARIGDPTDKTVARKQLTREEVMENVKSWIEQIKPLMDFDAKENPPEIVYNHDWLSKLNMEDVVNLASNFTVQRMLERDMFEKRLEEEKPIYLHEFMYPLMQGYDSVALDVDAELCGTDQTFNALVGRTLQRKFNNKEKWVVAVNLMENPKTGELMSKSRGTGIFLSFSAFDMYGAIMSQPDEMTKIFLINNTRIPLDEIEKIMSEANPRDAKMRASFEVTKIFHGDEGAAEAQEKFVKLVQKKESSEDIPVVSMGTKEISLFEAIKKCVREEISNSEIRRLIDQKSIRVEGEVVENGDTAIKIPETGTNLKIGKKRWYKITH
jgi:tyrosyl-tRNA synthetase